MTVLRDATAFDIDRLGRHLLYGSNLSQAAFEQVATHVVNTLYHEFTDSTGSPVFALVRLFRLCTADQLPPDLDTRALPASRHWVVLTATGGDEPAWNDRRRSRGHQAIPEQNARQSPMLQAVFQQIGLQWGDAAAGAFDTQPTELAMTRYFYIPTASGSPMIVDQATFVEPYGIQSVVGFGNTFVSGAGYVLIGFAKEAIDQPCAERWVALAPYIGTLMAQHDKTPLWGTA